MIPAKRQALFAKLHQRFPEPETELSFVNTFTLLVAVVLSAQSTDKGVNRATADLFDRVQTPQAMVDLGEEGLQKHIKTIGLYRAKAKNIIRLSQILVDKFGGQVPSTFDDLITLPGVGRKTANVVLNVAFGQPTMPVDTHVFRVSNRTGLAPGANPQAVEKKLLRVVPASFGQQAHHLLILLGRYICVARKPKCYACPVVEECGFKDKTKSEISYRSS